MTALLAAAVAGVGLVDPSAPVFYPDDEALLRGAAAFETVRMRGGGPVLLRRHVERLGRSALALRLPAPDGAAELAQEVAAAAGIDEGAIRLFRTGRTLVATAGPLPAGLEEMRRRGIAAVTIRTTSAGLLTGVKATSYATALAAVAQAEKTGAEDAIYLGEGETVLEATMSNVWWREGDVLVTPSLATGVLPGVTRGAVAAIARAAGYRDPGRVLHPAAPAALRRGVHELGGAGDHAARRGRRTGAAPRRSGAEAAGPARGAHRRLPWSA